MPNFLQMIFGDPNQKVLNELQADVEKINALEPTVQKLTDLQLKEKTGEFKDRLKNGETLDDIMHEVFAVVREAAMRTLGQRHFDVQLIGGIVMHRGGIAEMRTGEGKTLTSTAPLYLNALTGRGCHLVTVNDYLAKRDAVWMGQIFHALGLSVGVIQHEGGYLYDPGFKHEEGSDEEEDHDKERDETGAFRVHTDYLRPTETRREAYQADITYGTNNEFGFDYLRDNMVSRINQMAQREELYYAIVDEIDSILIDEARTPLIISAPAEESNDLYMRFAQIARGLKEDVHYNVDEKMRATALTEEGIATIEKALNIENMYASGGITMVHHAEQAVRAHALYKRDRDYVVRDNEVVIVDEFTGRLMEGRRYSEGLHQAIEAKEGVEIKRESETLATVTFQNYFRMYDKLAGMTGTAVTEAEEFGKIYNLEVTAIPTNMPVRRKDLPDRVYKTELGKFQAIVREVKRLQELGQPVLVGTVSIDKNEVLSELLKREGVQHNLLNAKNHEREAETIAQAGRPGAVTIATNMAGRGVDIVLGGNPKTPDLYEKVKEIGGLCVIGSERHESRRIDNQLRGRSGRQGDPGLTQFYVSMEDSLMRVFGSDKIKGMMERLGIPDDQPIENKMVSGSIEKAQHRVEGHHFDIRKHLLEYDDVLNKHRELIYSRRREILQAFEDENLDVYRDKILEIVEDEVEQVVLFHTGEAPESLQGDGKRSSDWNTKEIIEVVATMIPMTEEKRKEFESIVVRASEDKMDVAEQRTKIIETVMQAAREAYDVIAGRFEKREHLKEVERNVVLRAIDRLWINHLDAMKQLRTGIGLQGYGQRDPLIEYKKESFGMFNMLLASINQQIAQNFFKYAAHVAQAAEQQLRRAKSVFERAGIIMSGAAKTSGTQGGTSSTSTTSTTSNTSVKKVGRNDSCPCGSGLKYKKCHGA